MKSLKELKIWQKGLVYGLILGVILNLLVVVPLYLINYPSGGQMSYDFRHVPYIPNMPIFPLFFLMLVLLGPFYSLCPICIGVIAGVISWGIVSMIIAKIYELIFLKSKKVKK